MSVDGQDLHARLERGKERIGRHSTNQDLATGSVGENEACLGIKGRSNSRGRTQLRRCALGADTECDGLFCRLQEMFIVSGRGHFLVIDRHYLHAGFQMCHGSVQVHQVLVIFHQYHLLGLFGCQGSLEKAKGGGGWVRARFFFFFFRHHRLARLGSRTFRRNLGGLFLRSSRGIERRGQFIRRYRGGHGRVHGIRPHALGFPGKQKRAITSR